MAIRCGNMIVGGVPTTPPTPVEPVAAVRRIESISVKLAKQAEQENSETHIKLKDGELERLIPKKSSYMMDLGLGSE